MSTKIKTFEEACKALGTDPEKSLPTVTGVPAKHQEAITAHCKLVIITEALNEGWVPNWKDSNEYKYYPWFDLSSGSSLSADGFVVWISCSAVGSRLCFKSRKLAEYAGNNFKKLYEQYFLIK